MPLVDTHCHLQMARFDKDRSDVLERSLARLEWLAVVGDNLESSLAACRMTQERVHAVVGFHPYHAAALDKNTETELRGLAGHAGVIALGEIGLDYFNEYCPRRLQQPAFRQQLALAAELDMPVVIHSRAAEDNTLAILRDHGPHPAACIMHCFGGDARFAEKCLELGCFISFAGNVSYPKAEQLRDAARIVPQDKLLLETDAPYLAPQCIRGKRCEPWHVEHTLSFMADLLDTPEETLAARINDNAARAFQLTK